MSESTASSSSCPKCGAALPSAATAGLCPRCLMAEAMAPTQADTEPAEARPTHTPEELAPHFPQLEILECLGRGGMGVVYKARQKSLDRLVALKLLAPERVGDPNFADRFSREAHALAALNHPNIVTVHDFGHAGGFYFLLMEFVDGVNLRQLLRARKFTPEEALTIVPPLCDALQFAHERSIVHRDIKPENILLDKAGRVKVADFGIAKMLGPDNGDSPGRTVSREGVTQSAIGTPGYSAPEQKTEPQRVDSRADIFSLGVVFYEMLTGELPGKPIEPPSRKVQIDVRLDQIVLRALEQQPELRYQQASQVKTDVETVSGSATPPSNPKPPEAITGQPPANSGLPAIVFTLSYACFLGYLVHSAQWLPARMASHFGSDLKADGWMPRREFLQIIRVVPLIFPLIFLGIYAVVRGVRGSASIATHVLRQGLWFACLFTIFVAGIQYLSVQANKIDLPRLPTGSFLFLIIGFLIVSVIFAIQAIYRSAMLDSPKHSTEAIASNTQRVGERTSAMNVLYSDRLIEITDQEIVFRRYYFPFGDRHVPWSQIESVEMRPPSIWFGSWRIWGGGPVTWFPLDWARPSRDAIFVAFLQGRVVRIGFTVQRSKEVAEVLRQRGLLQRAPSA